MMYLLPLYILVSWGVEPVFRKDYTIPYKVENAKSAMVQIHIKPSKIVPGFFISNTIAITSFQSIKEAFLPTHKKVIHQSPKSWFAINGSHFNKRLIFNSFDGEYVAGRISKVLAVSSFHNLAFLRVTGYTGHHLSIYQYDLSEHNDLVYFLNLPATNRDIFSIGKLASDSLFNTEALEFVNTPLDVFTFPAIFIISKINDAFRPSTEVVSIRSKSNILLSGIPLLNSEGQVIGVLNNLSVGLTQMTYVNDHILLNNILEMIHAEPSENQISEIAF